MYRSTGTNGASWNFPGRPVAEFNDVAGTGAALLDKQLLTVDDKVGSPYQDRVYVTWTLFAPDGTAYIYEAYSKDYGESFSDPVLVSGDSALCTQTFGVPHPARRVQREPVLAAVHRPRRCVVRGLGELQQRHQRRPRWRRR